MREDGEMDLYLTRVNNPQVVHINTKGQGDSSDHKVLKIKIDAIDIVSKKYVVSVRISGILIKRRIGPRGIEPVKDIRMDLTETGVLVKKKRIVS